LLRAKEKGSRSSLPLLDVRRVENVPVLLQPLVREVPLAADFHDGQDARERIGFRFESPLIFLAEVKPVSDNSGSRHSKTGGRIKAAVFAAAAGIPPSDKVETATSGEPYYLFRR
jgi:hypothetical protein